jgi:signal transduction histidine kinase
MPSSTDAGGARASTEAVALLEKIEELSLLRALCDGFAAAADFPAACRALTDLVWDARGAVGVAYLAIAPSGVAAVASTTPDDGLGALVDPAVLARLVHAIAPITSPDPVVLEAGSRRLAGARGALLWVPTRLRGVLTGGLLVETEDDRERVAGDLRLLAIVAAMAALGLDAARRQAREDFLATLRHDIRNPVDAALGYLEMADDRLAEHGLAEVRTYLAAANDALRAVDDLVVNDLQLAAIDRAHPLVGRGEVDLTALAVAILDRFRPAATHRRIELVAPRGSTRVSGDRRQLARVVTNLVDNAIKYMRDGGRVEVSVAAAGDEAILAVRDSGWGLLPDEVGRLFRKNIRLHADVRIPGSGLGLYLSKAIVEAHGGSIEVSSVPGEGSTFLVRLPVGATRLAPVSLHAH